MKRTISIIVWILPLVLLAQEPDLYEPVNYKWAVENGTRSRDGKPGPNYWQNHADYNISVRLDTAENKIYGEETVIYYNESPDTLDRIVIRLYPNRYKKGAIKNLAVNPGNLHDGVELTSLAINNIGLPVSDSSFLVNPFALTSFDTLSYVNGTNIAIYLKEQLLPGKTLNLFCEWNYKIATKPEFRRTGHYKDNAWFIGYFYPQIAVYDDLEYFSGIKGWDFMLSHKGWQEFYNDFNNYNVNIEVPHCFYVWATGTLVNPEQIYKPTLYQKIQEAKSSDKIVHLITENDLTHDYLKGNIWHFKAMNVPDFAFGTASGYLWDATSVQVANRRVFVDAAYHPESDYFNFVINEARSTIEYTSSVFPGIPYPWEHTTTFNGMLRGGMEFPMIANNSNIQDTITTYYVTFHEIFHNYTPFMMGFNEKRYPFMDEGLTDMVSTEYMSDVHHVVYHSSAPGSQNRIDDYNYYAVNEDNPMYNAYANSNDYNIVYQYYVKPYIAYTLFREMVGRDNFLMGLKEFVRRWQGKHPTPYDLFYTMNDVLKENYNWFWKAWFFEPGYPDLGLELSGQNVIVKRVGEGSLPLPVRLQILYNDGSIKHIERPMDIWKNGTKEIKIKLDQFENINEISLDTELIPDIDLSNNSIVFSAHAQYETVINKDDPDILIPISFDSHGSKLRGYFSKALGDGPHPTIILLHGSPGGNKDIFGLAQAAPKAGWNALVFNYRGFYESEGISSLKNSVEDVFSAINFLRSDETAKKYRIDVDHISLAGYSYGGDIALTAAAGDPSIKYVISIAAADLSEIARLAEKSEEFKSVFLETMNDRYINGPVKGPGGKEALEELLENKDKYDLVKHAENLSGKSLLIIGGWNDQASTLEEHVLPLIRALQSQGAEKVEKVILDTNHSFEGKREELANVVIKWLKDNHPGDLNAPENYGKPGILKYVRVYSDSIGDTHFEDMEINLDEIDFAPPAPPIYTSELISSASYGFLSVLPGWESEWHPTPERQFMIYLSGIIEAEVSDGEIRQFGPGSITLVEDTFGKGHKSKALGNDKIVLAVIQLK